MIANFIAGLFTGLWFYLVLLAIGAVVGIGAWLVGRFTGLLGAAAFGALALLAAYVSGSVDQFSSQRDKAQIAALQAELLLKSKKIDEIAATNAVLIQSVEDAADAAEHNAVVIGNLEKWIEQGDPDCKVTKEFLDELDKIR